MIEYQAERQPDDVSLGQAKIMNGSFECWRGFVGVCPGTVKTAEDAAPYVWRALKADTETRPYLDDFSHVVFTWREKNWAIYRRPNHMEVKEL